MNSYTLILDHRRDTDDLNLTVTPIKNHGVYTNGEFLKMLRLKSVNNYVNFYNITEETTPRKHSVPNWESFNVDKPLSKTIMSIDQCTEVVLKLSDKLPTPNSYILNVYWFFDSSNLLVLPQISNPLLKLKFWHNADIRIVTEAHSEFIEPYLTLFKVELFYDKLTSINIDNNVLWKGSVGFYNFETKKNIVSESVFEIKFDHINDMSSLFHQVLNIESSEKIQVEENFWLDHCLQVEHFVTVSSIPLLLLSGDTMTLSCTNTCKVGQNLNDCLTETDAVLCSLQFSLTKDSSFASVKNKSDHWKRSLGTGDNNSLLKMPDLKLQVPTNTIYFLLSLPKQISDGYLTFKMQPLNIPQEMCMDFLIQQATNPVKSIKKCQEILPYKKIKSDILLDASFDLQACFDEVIKSEFADKKPNDRDIVDVYSSLLKCYNKSIVGAMFERFAVECPNCEVDVDHVYQKHEISEEYLNNPVNRALGEREKRVVPVFEPDKLVTKDDLNKKNNGQLLMLFTKQNKEKIKSSLNDVLSKQGAKSNLKNGYKKHLCDKEGEKFELTALKTKQQYIWYDTLSLGSLEFYKSPNYTKEIIENIVKFSRNDSERKENLLKIAQRIKNRKSMPVNQEPLSPRSTVSGSSHKMTLRSTPRKLKSGVLDQAHSVKRNSGGSAPSVPSSVNSQKKLTAKDKQRTGKNKEVLRNLVEKALKSYGVKKTDEKYNEHNELIFNKSLEKLKSLRSSRGLVQIMQEEVKKQAKELLEKEEKEATLEDLLTAEVEKALKNEVLEESKYEECKRKIYDHSYQMLKGSLEKSEVLRDKVVKVVKLQTQCAFVVL